MGCSGNCGGGSENHRESKRSALSSTKIKKTIAILSGKGGVGKSMVTSLLAVSLARAGYKVGVLDADITGPSIPRFFGVEKQSMYGDEQAVYPLLSSRYQIKLVSLNMMMENEDEPALWRGPIITNMVNQFYNDVYWEELDYLLIDMPPGTGDVALTVFSDLPIDEIVMVSTPSKMVSMIVSKAIKMAEVVKCKVLGLVENMAYVKNGDQVINIYDQSDIHNLCEKYQLELLASLPLSPQLAKIADEGAIEEYEGNDFETLITKL